MAALKSQLLYPGMRIGLYGGTFDPPHDGHLHVARTALRRLGLDRVWWLVSPGNPFKAHPPAAFSERLEAVRALAPEPRQTPSDFEASLSSTRTVDVVRRLQDRRPDVRFVWIMGADALAGLHRWKDWRSIVRRVPLCVVARPGDPMRARLSPAARYMRRARVCESRAHALVSLPPPVWTYLTEPLHPHASRLLRAERHRPEAADRAAP